MKPRSRVKAPKRLTVDVRGLAAFEQKEGALVEMGRYIYRVLIMVNGKALLERVDSSSGEPPSVLKPGGP